MSMCAKPSTKAVCMPYMYVCLTRDPRLRAKVAVAKGMARLQRAQPRPPAAAASFVAVAQSPEPTDRDTRQQHGNTSNTSTCHTVTAHTHGLARASQSRHRCDRARRRRNHRAITDADAGCEHRGACPRAWPYLPRYARCSFPWGSETSPVLCALHMA
jgi:hypothetical protein